MKGNKDKYRVFLCTNEILQVKIGAALRNNSKCEKLLGVKIDNKLMFDVHVTSICKKASAKINVLNRVAKYMCTEKRLIIINTFFSSQLIFVKDRQISQIMSTCFL